MEQLTTYLIYGIIAIIIIILIVIFIPSGSRKKKRNKRAAGSKITFYLESKTKTLEFYNPFINFLVYGGAGSGKTKSICKNLLSEYIRNGFAGVIYDYKDFDLTKTAYNLTKKHNFDYPFYYISFTDMSKTYRINPISTTVITDENLFIQVIEDLFNAYQQDSKKDEWYNGALGILKGVAIRFYYDYPQYCTIPHIVNFILLSGRKKLTLFLKGHTESRKLAGAFIDAEDSEKTQASYLSSLSNKLSNLSFNKNIAYVLSGNDFDFNLLDPNNPKLISIANSYKIENVIGPVVAMMISISSRQFSLTNKIPFFYCFDEATTFKISDFEKMPSVLREYLCSFTIITQSSAKIEKVYGKNDKSSIEANMGNQFFGRTKDLIALKSYPFVFGKEEKERLSKSKGANASGKSTSTTVSTQKEEKYDSNFFTKLKAGEFVGTASDANVDNFHLEFCMYNDKEEVPLPPVNPVLPIDVENNYNKILDDIYNIS